MQILTAMRMADDELINNLIEETKKEVYYELLDSPTNYNKDNVNIIKTELLRRLRWVIGKNIQIRHPIKMANI